MPDDDITDKTRVTAEALEAKAASVADDLQDVAIEQASKLQATMRDLAAQMIELAKEMKSLSQYGRRNRRLIRLLTVSVVFDLVLSVGLGVAFWRTQQNSDRTDQILEARKEGRAATCSAFDGLVGALVGAGEAPVDETERAARQARVDSFVADFEGRLAPLGCDLAVPTIPPPGG